MQQIVDFIRELDKLKGVTRKAKPLGLERYENSAEHSWQIALLAASLARHAAAEVDIDRVIAMLLVHDIGEIDTGDTIVFAKEGLQERKAAERVAVMRIFHHIGRFGHGLREDLLNLLRDDFFHDVRRCHESENRFGLFHQQAGCMLAFKQQRRFADGHVTWHLHDPWCHHTGYHSWYNMRGLRGLFVRTGHW